MAGLLPSPRSHLSISACSGSVTCVLRRYNSVRSRRLDRRAAGGYQRLSGAARWTARAPWASTKQGGRNSK
jgi:hypothetical protein